MQIKKTNKKKHKKQYSICGIYWCTDFSNELWDIISIIHIQAHYPSSRFLLPHVRYKRCLYVVISTLTKTLMIKTYQRGFVTLLFLIVRKGRLLPFVGALNIQGIHSSILIWNIVDSDWCINESMKEHCICHSRVCSQLIYFSERAKILINIKGAR